ncbi:MAG: hypothetical protein ACOY9D_12340 [Pseudomonadota bacterium]
MKYPGRNSKKLPSFTFKQVFDTLDSQFVLHCFPNLGYLLMVKVTVLSHSDFGHAYTQAETARVAQAAFSFTGFQHDNAKQTDIADAADRRPGWMWRG